LNGHKDNKIEHLNNCKDDSIQQVKSQRQTVQQKLPTADLTFMTKRWNNKSMRTTLFST
jgi:hypothetical protein